MKDDMSDNLTIPIPCDDDGYFSLKCPRCGELFKLRPADYKADDVVDICCPSCGIVSENYPTDDVVELATTMALNNVMEDIHKSFKRLERKTRNRAVSFKAGKPPRKEPEPVLRPPVDDLTVATCENCGKRSKISPLLKMSAFTCPFCGVTNFNER